MAIADSSIPDIEVLAAGHGKYHPVDPDGHRLWVRDHKERALTSKLMTEKEAVERFVADGDYLVYECNYLTRGPNAVLHEVIRQKRKDLWLGGKFTYVDVGLLVGAGCASKVDCGFFLAAPCIQQAVNEGRLEVYEYSNVVMTLRLQAGAMGLPFLPVRSFGGTDGFEHSGARLIRDPYTGIPITIVPALNPDVAIIHVQQADVYGNARVFGTGISDVESAMASKKVIVSAEEIVSTDEIRRAPGLTSIPYYAVDAVVWAPFSSYPGTCPGYHASDPPAVMEVFGAVLRGGTDAYLEKWVYGMADHSEMLEKRVGTKKLLELQRREVITEGFRP
jgi:acyl CoA:acetate/3-ketoacid CoA transferase alpha subunit